MNSNNIETFDMIIIGGGATGAGIALDATLRGYKVLLLEKDDFASGTSSKSSKLIHGGVRYLEKAVKQLDMAQYNLVKEALYERALFIKNAPHLAKKLKLDTPIYNNFEIFYVYLGLLIYQLISGKNNIGENSFINKTLFALLQPSIKKDGLEGAVSFFDGRFIDSRMVIALLQTANSLGAQVKNYSEVKEFIYKSSNRLDGLNYQDVLSGETIKVKSNCIINATGANIDNIRFLDDKNVDELLTLSSGIHIVIPKEFLPNDEAILIPKTSDGRVVFVLPYLGECLVGTTDNEVQYSDNPKAKDEDIDFLLDQINSYFDKKVSKDDILSTWCGIRPLIKIGQDSVSSDVVREHSIEISKSNLISIAGGKWTTYRKMAEELIDFAIENRVVNKRKRCKTKHYRLEGSKLSLRKTKYELEQTAPHSLKKQTIDNLLNLYGNKSLDVLDIAVKYNAFELIHKDLPFIKAEIIYSIKFEFVQRPIDFLARRISLCFIDKQKALECVRYVTSVMKTKLLWDEKKENVELENTIKQIKELF